MCNKTFSPQNTLCVFIPFKNFYSRDFTSPLLRSVMQWQYMCKCLISVVLSSVVSKTCLHQSAIVIIINIITTTIGLKSLALTGSRWHLHSCRYVHVYNLIFSTPLNLKCVSIAYLFLIVQKREMFELQASLSNSMSTRYME